MEERQYMDTLLQDILEGMDENIEKFYYKQQQTGNIYFKNSFENAVCDVVKSYFSGPLNPDKLAKLHKKTRDYKFKKKKRWAENIKQYALLEYDDKKYPFKDLVNLKISLSETEWKEKFHGKNFDNIVEDKLNEVDTWRASRKTKMIEFPMLTAFTPKASYDAFEMDVFFEAYREINEIFDNAKNSYLKSYLLEMGEGPYFTTSRKKYNLDQGTGVIPMSEDGTSKLVFEVNRDFFGDNSLKMMDSKDLEILNYLIDVNPDMMIQNAPILVETSDLAKIVAGNNRPSSVHYDEAERRCFQMANITYNKFVEDKQVGAINWLDSAIKRNIDGSRYMEIVLGSRLANSILSNRISRLPAPAYERLHSGSAKLLYLPLQKRRILTFQRYEKGEVDSLKSTFTYNDFLMMINFGSGRKAQNYNTICNAFQEYVDKKEVIEHFDTNRSSYTIDVYFYPLSEEEKRNMKNFNIISDNTKKVQNQQGILGE